jgi:5-formyltetrahydrofolate cyclo-ligase
VLAAGGTLLLPRIVRTPQRHLELHAVGDPARDLIAGPWGIREPDPQRCPRMTLADATCVLVPGVAFDATGARLGYGGGFYDRLLATAPTVPRIAAAFDLQLVDAVPVDAHDLRVDRVITPTREIALPPRPDARR